MLKWAHQFCICQLRFACIVAKVVWRASCCCGVRCWHVAQQPLVLQQHAHDKHYCYLPLICGAFSAMLLGHAIKYDAAPCLILPHMVVLHLSQHAVLVLPQVCGGCLYKAACDYCLVLHTSRLMQHCTHSNCIHCIVVLGCYTASIGSLQICYCSN
jgi:hypothetical protein